MAALPTLRSLLPAALPAALGTIVGLQCAALLTDLYGAGEAPPPAVATPPPAIAARWNLQSLLDAHLFGEASTSGQDGSQAPATSLALVLSGIIASEDPQQGYAIVGESAATARMHAVGGALPGGARLHSVYPDRVVLDRNGSLESLALPKRPLASLAPSPAAAPAASAASAVASPDPQLEQMKQAMQRDPTALSEVIRAQQVLAGGRQRGFRVYPGNNPRAFSRLGLRPGDLIIAVNGTPLDDPARGEEVMRTLGSAAEARVTIVRNGRDTDVVLDLAAIAGELNNPSP